MVADQKLPSKGPSFCYSKYIKLKKYINPFTITLSISISISMRMSMSMNMSIGIHIHIHIHCTFMNSFLIN